MELSDRWRKVTGAFVIMAIGLALGATQLIIQGTTQTNNRWFYPLILLGKTSRWDVDTYVGEFGNALRVTFVPDVHVTKNGLWSYYSTHSQHGAVRTLFVLGVLRAVFYGGMAVSLISVALLMCSALRDSARAWLTVIGLTVLGLALGVGVLIAEAWYISTRYFEIKKGLPVIDPVERKDLAVAKFNAQILVWWLPPIVAGFVYLAIITRLYLLQRPPKDVM